MSKLARVAHCQSESAPTCHALRLFSEVEGGVEKGVCVGWWVGEREALARRGNKEITCERTWLTAYEMCNYCVQSASCGTAAGNFASSSSSFSRVSSA